MLLFNKNLNDYILLEILANYNFMVKSSFKMVLILASALGGTLSYLGFKAQNSALVYEGPFYKPFFHPYMQMVSIFFSMFICLIPLVISRWWNPQYYERQAREAQKQGKLLSMNKYLLAVPALCDFVSAILDNAGLNFINPSSYQMLRAGTVLTTLIFTKIMTTYEIKRREMLGMIVVLIGIIMAGAANIIFTDENIYGPSKVPFYLLQSEKITGYMLIVLSLFFDGFSHVFEGELINKYYLNPLLAVGFQGLFGLWISLFILPLVSFIPCYFEMSACTYDGSGKGFLESPFVYFTSILDNKPIQYFCIMSVVGYSFNYSFGVYVTKYVNALARPLIELIETIFMWGFGLILTITVGKIYPNFVWQIADLRVVTIVVFGFGVVVLGNLIYVRAIKIDNEEDQEEEGHEGIFEESSKSDEGQENNE